MIWMFKLIGLVLIFLVCASFGVHKSVNLKVREQKLEEIRGCMQELSARLLYDGSERLLLLKAAFMQKGIIGFSEDVPQVLSCGINEADKQLLEEFLSLFGSGDTNAELGRIELYLKLFERNLADAAKENSQLSKLYKTLGICCGAGMCIILI
ncbi:MAG: hypothetical protein E7562_05445 [Ruminococcaceae bacterium]|nr:hypothetical protein [Oscillospiraceae bacterium]